MKFKQMSNIKSRAWVGAVAGILSLTVAAATQAAFVPVANPSNESPGAALGAGTAGVAGTVVAFKAAAFTMGAGFDNTPTSGVLRSMVVDSGVAGQLDFYYQVLNTTGGAAPLLNNGNDIFRFVGKGFDSFATSPLPLGVTYRSEAAPLATLANTGILPASWFTSQTGTTVANAFSADRDPALASVTGVGIDFDATQLFNTGVPGGPTSAPGNVEAGQISDWLVVRTNSTVFTNSIAEIDSGAGTAFSVADFAPIPEPTTVVFGLALTGVCLNSIRRNRKKA